MKALEITGLRKAFKSNFLFRTIPVLKDVNLSVEKGEIYGFLGPNGAGKTTTIKSILGIIFPDAGDISIFEQSYRKTKSRNNIGYLPEHPYFYDYLTPEELLRFTGRLYGLSSSQMTSRIGELIQMVGLAGKEKIKLKKFSKGMIQRVGLAQSLVHNPELLILDEPFSGLDPLGRKELRDMIFSLKGEGKTVFFSSHILQDMEMMVDKVGIIIKGEIKKEGKLSNLISRSIRYSEIIFKGVSEGVIKKWEKEWVFQDGNYKLNLHQQEDINALIKLISKEKGEVISVNPIKMTLEDIFLEEMNS